MHLSKYHLSSSFKEQGKWWTQCGQLENARGLLSYQPGKMLKLVLDGEFDFELRENDELGLILGITKSGLHVSLLSPMVLADTYSPFTPLSSITYGANAGLIGDAHVAGNEVFHSARVGITNIEPWINRQPYKYHSEIKDDGERLTSLEHLCSLPTKFSIPNIEATIAFSNRFQYDTTAFRVV